MLAAVNTGFSVLPSCFLSSRRSIRFLRLASCWCILAFTRNPFLLVLMVARYNIRRRRNTRDFELFQFIASPKRGGFACSRASITAKRLRQRHLELHFLVVTQDFDLNRDAGVLGLHGRHVAV